jgi:hypothetical protein
MTNVNTDELIRNASFISEKISLNIFESAEQGGKKFFPSDYKASQVCSLIAMVQTISRVRATLLEASSFDPSLRDSLLKLEVLEFSQAQDKLR